MAQPLRFGVATADHQCEAYDGRDDIRDVWERVRGLVGRGKATDFWNRYREDVALARSADPRPDRRTVQEITDVHRALRTCSCRSPKLVAKGNANG